MFISVVVAVRNELQYIEKCVTSLFNQTYNGLYEVIVVDGMSTDGTYERLQALQQTLAFTLLRNPKLNAAAGRNIGIEHAQGDHIAFIDADAVAAPDWLEQIKEAFENNNAVGVGGPDLLPEDSSELARMIGLVMTSPLASGGRLNPSTQHVMLDEERWVEHIPTVNLCLKRAIFDEVGLFDEHFVKGQDLELSYRIVQAGYKLLYSPRIQVVHYRKETIGEFSKQIYKWAEAKVAILKKHKTIRHAYLLPVYGTLTIFILLALSLIFNVFLSFFFVLLLGILLYVLFVALESIRLTKNFNNGKVFLYGLLLIPIVHVSYTIGACNALIRRKMW
ncbi:MAG: glycosyltransferase family 2 protein [Candidatus Methanospirareceae archaeon]